ncbi:Transposon, En/Spm-like protein [Corchorus capsularis]|uniref:Transposon, En/Spm-like protein n=1 Tax=Corchorus capsularis TaxID=210143 RepID=A0A1R3J9U0_COCAP|nr:Transposon, En/Spm-like protein [Corchorus capsularis]
MLYWGDRVDQESCHVCGSSRWLKPNSGDAFNEDGGQGMVKLRPAKVLRYFPLIPRLQRLFMSSKTLESMTWHADGRTDDRDLRHPTDSLALKDFDSRYSNFASETRNVLLGLATDGFNPFKTMSTTYSHTFRHQKRTFDNTVELREAPTITPSSEILEMLRSLQFSYGKKKKKAPKRRKNVEDVELEDDDEDGPNEAAMWKKMSIFFELVYWEHNLLRHNLDVMHIEKNVCDNILRTILGIDGKSKDNLNSRLDLVEMGIRHDLHPQLAPNGKTIIPPACYAMSKKEKDVFCGVLKNINVPDGYASNISRCVNVTDQKLYNLKPHDCHILLHDLLPIALRSSMQKKETKAIIELCNIFKALCAKVLKLDELDKLQDRAALALCNLGKIFPSSFFTIMVHLFIHLPLQAKLGGPVFARWMYPIERFLGKLGSYVLNKWFPEGSIAEGYLAKECMTFYSRYLEDIETRFNRPSRNPGCPENDSCSAILKIFTETFHEWFRDKVLGGLRVFEEVGNLARGPKDTVKRYKTYCINGYRFKVRELDSGRTQNSRQKLDMNRKGMKEKNAKISISKGASKRKRQDQSAVGGNSQTNSAGNRNSQHGSIGSVQLPPPPPPPSGPIEVGAASTPQSQNPSPSPSLPADFHPPNSNPTTAASVPAVSHPPEGDVPNDSQPITVEGALNLDDDAVKVDVNGERRLAKITLGKLWNAIPPHRVVVESNEFGQPIGNEAKLLGGYLGKFSRQYTTLPVIPDSWKKLPMDRKTAAMDLVKIKKKEDAERIAMYIKTHTRKNEQALNSETQAVMDKAKELKAAASVEDGHNLDQNELESRIMVEVCGPERHGRMRGHGFGVTQTVVFNCRANLFTYSKTGRSSEVQQLREENQQKELERKQELGKIAEERKQELARLEEQRQKELAEINARMDAERRENARTKCRLDNLMRLVAAKFPDAVLDDPSESHQQYGSQNRTASGNGGNLFVNTSISSAQSHCGTKLDNY